MLILNNIQKYVSYTIENSAVSNTKTNRLTPSGEVIAVCSYSRTEFGMGRRNLVAAVDACSNPCALMLDPVETFTFEMCP
jgi:1-aminocyclopropane-1-carboxylate deaminase/D-cysteine desulfhydrase-like pyridoxal-dependent ACC family enzyme